MIDENFSTIQDVIKRAMNKHPQRNKLSETAIMNAWKGMMPSGVHEKTRGIYIRDNKLFVNIESSALKHTLQMNKVRILDELNAMNFDISLLDIVLV